MLATILACSTLAAVANQVFLTETSLYHKKFYCEEKTCFFPEKSLKNDDLVVSGRVAWNRDENLVLHTTGNIIFEKNSELIIDSDCSLTIKAGMEPKEAIAYTNRIDFLGDNTQIKMLGAGNVSLYYNPIANGAEHKYANPRASYFKKHISMPDENKLNLYLLVNDLHDLQNINISLSVSYALSQDIDASDTKSWNNGQGFKPLKNAGKNMPFSGNFDGNGYKIIDLFINRPEEDKVGLFGMISGRRNHHNTIKNLELLNFKVTGDHYVGGFAGWMTYVDTEQIALTGSYTIVGKDVVGGLVGAMRQSDMKEITVDTAKDNLIEATEYKGYLAGSSKSCTLSKIAAYAYLLELNKPDLMPSPKNPYIGAAVDTEVLK